jgi:branched-chain amino acid transport system permease protein
MLGYTSPGLGEQVAHKVLGVSIIAGLGNLPGGLVVGLALGILEALIQGYLPGSWSNAIAFVALLVVILAKPRGLFGIKL